MKLSAVVLGGEADPYLYLEVASLTTHETTVQFRSVSTAVVSPAQMLVSDASLAETPTGRSGPRLQGSDRHWVYLGTDYDRFYQLSGVKVVHRLAPSADRIGNVWLIRSSPSSLSVTYLPTTEFTWELAGVICVFALALFGLLALTIQGLRRRRQAAPTTVPELPELPDDPWGPAISAPGPAIPVPGSRRSMNNKTPA
jgi:hypothetical protein